MKRRRVFRGACAALVLAPVLFVAPAAQSAATRVAAHTKRTAERNVVRVAPHSWNHRRIAGLIDAHTGLLRNNVRAICHARGKRHIDKRYARFLCVVRSWPAAGRLQLFVSYRALPHGRCRMHWLRLQKRA